MNPGFCIIVLVIASMTAMAHAQDADMPANQESVEVKISQAGDVRVKHVIKDSESAQELKLLDGNVAKISAVDESGNDVAFTMSDESTHILLRPSEDTIRVEYDLLDELVQIDGVWTLDFSYKHTTSFLVPDVVDLIFVNDRPVYLGERNGIACHGCHMLLEYIIDEPSIFESVKWEEDEFLVEIRTLADIGRLEFEQPSKSIKFDLDGKGDFVTVIIPTELVGEPYSVFLDDEKIYFNEYINNGTHAWLNARPDSGGELRIIGTTVIPEFSLMIPIIAGFAVIVAVSRFKASFPARAA